MKKTSDASISEVLNVVERDPIHGPLFWWFYDNHADLLRRAAGRRINWTELCPKLTQLGLTDQTGKPMSKLTARRTWARVCRMKEQMRIERDKRRPARARESERGPNADRPPPIVAAPAPRPPVPHYSPPPLPMMPVQGTADQRPHSELSQEERRARTNANVLRLRRKFAETSGRNPDEIE